MNKKVFILLPDGVGLRNFAFTQFNILGLEKGFDSYYWNNTMFDLKSLGYNEIKIENAKLHPFTDFYKSAKIQVELNNFVKKTSDQVYNSYRFPFKGRNFKSKVKYSFIKLLIRIYNSEKGILKIKDTIKKLESSTPYFQHCVKVLEHNNPAFVFCTNQRPALAIAPILAAKKMDIPTGTFIFSWDNLPKATLIVETDYYFVWSDFMKKELLFYYPHINAEQVIISGTPQFEMHFNTSNLINKYLFKKKYNLINDKKYICFSGDDVTTSPNDHFYLEDVAKAVRNLNLKGHNLGIVYRKCPVDFSDRHLNIYKDYSDVIILIDPLWENLGNSWNTVMPLKGDTDLLVSTVNRTELVINVGSSMVFDFIAQNKPCAYLNYNTDKSIDKNWNIEKIYKFIHFRSMPTDKVVLWINSQNEIENVIIKVLSGQYDLEATSDWFSKICYKPKQSSKNIWGEIEKIIE